MPLREVINILVGKFGPRVKFLEVDQLGLNVRLAGHEYSISRTDSFLVCEEIVEGDITEATKGSKWLTAILLVDACGTMRGTWCAGDSSCEVRRA